MTTFVKGKARLDRLETIKRLLAKGYRQVEIADMLGISKQALGQLIKRNDKYFHS